jgi:hypothetical protein
MWAQQLIAPFRLEKGEVAAPDADALQPGEVSLRLDAVRPARGQLKIVMRAR